MNIYTPTFTSNMSFFGHASPFIPQICWSSTLKKLMTTMFQNFLLGDISILGWSRKPIHSFLQQHESASSTCLTFNIANFIHNIKHSMQENCVHKLVRLTLVSSVVHLNLFCFGIVVNNVEFWDAFLPSSSAGLKTENFVCPFFVIKSHLFAYRCSLEQKSQQKSPSVISHSNILKHISCMVIGQPIPPQVNTCLCPSSLQINQNFSISRSTTPSVNCDKQTKKIRFFKI